MRVPGVVVAATFSDISRWARGKGLEIVMLVSGALLLARLITWLTDRFTRRIDDRGKRVADELVRSEESKHLHAVAQVTRWLVIVLLYFVAALLVLQRLGVPVSGLAAPGAVVGVALGLGAQRIVQDLLSGFFIIVERQYGFGDVIRIASPGSSAGVSGTVEALTLRTTRLRTINGELLIIPNGELRQVTNLSRDWARAVIDVPVPVGEDVNEATTVLRHVCDEAYQDHGLQPLLLDPPSVMGVEKIEQDYLVIRVIARTLPGKQFDVGRDLRARVAHALREAGIEMSVATAAAVSTAQPSATS
jgi:small conductance mechanosensitive channel